MKEFMEVFLEGGIAVHCEKKGQANKFLKILEEETEITWASGHKPTKKNYHEVYKKNTCYEILDGYLRYSELEYFEDRDFEIITFEEILEETGVVVEEEVISQDEVIKITDGEVLHINGVVQEGDYLELQKDEDGDFRILVNEDDEEATIVLDQVGARKLALVILANLDIPK